MGLVSSLIRQYTLNTPVKKGKYRLADLAMSLSGELPEQIVVRTTDGRELAVNTANGSYRYIYYLGEYEEAITDVFRALVRPGDVCLDIGANMGWYTTLFQKLVGSNGVVHAFEPVPPTFERLARNVRMNRLQNVRLNDLALGDEEKDVELHIFDNLPDGHASIATFGQSDFQSFTSRMIMLDTYLEETRTDNVRLVKMDIEGAELMMLKGASRLFEQETVPVIEVEMALATTRGFGYLPNDLIRFIREKADYDFFTIDERRFKLKQIDGFRPEDEGANVLCLPAGFDRKPLSRWFS